MFGLDARIALAIFGALSVISGAALYSAIQQSKFTALLVDLNEIGKAYESYLLDVGSNPPFIDTINLNTAALVDGSISGSNSWRGSYISGTPRKVGASVINVDLMRGSLNIVLTKAKTGAWSTWTGGALVCTDKSECAIYARIHPVDLELAKALDEYVDGTIDAKTGKVKYEASSSYIYVYYYIAPSSDLSIGTKVY